LFVLFLILEYRAMGGKCRMVTGTVLHENTSICKSLHIST
jgi:hypothetical protein